MSVTQTYYLAHKARAKLSSEAGRPDHNLRLLVGHANLLDSLMLELADAEREQESWFNQSVRGATKTEERHVQWADTVIEEPEADWEAEDAESDSSSDSDSDFDDEEDVEMANTVSLRRVPSHKAAPRETDAEFFAHETIYEEEEEEDYADLAHAVAIALRITAGARPRLRVFRGRVNAAITTINDPAQLLRKAKEQHAAEEDLYNEAFYLPARNPARLVSAISVY